MMKILLLSKSVFRKATAVSFFLLGFIINTSAQTNYYPKDSNATSLQLLSTWGTNTDGSGTAPTSFTAPNQIFNVYNSIGTTAFGTDSGWTVSGSGSKIVIPAGDTLTITRILTIGASANINAGFTCNGVVRGDTLTIIGSSSATVANWFLVSGGSMLLHGQISPGILNFPSNNKITIVAGSYFDITTPTVTVKGTVANNGIINANTIAVSNASGDFENSDSVNCVTIAIGTGGAVYNTTVAHYTMCSGVSFSGGSAKLTNAGTTIITGTIANTAGGITNTGLMNCSSITATSGSAQLTNGGTLNVSGNIASNNGNYTNSGTLNCSGTITLGSNFTNTGHVYSTGAGGITGSAATDRWTNGTNGYLEVAGPFMMTGSLTATATNNTIKYNSLNTDQTVKGATYYNLVIAKLDTVGSGQTATLGAATTVTGSLTIASGLLDVSASNYTITMRGNWIDSSLFMPRAGQVVFSTTSAQTIFSAGTEVFYNVRIFTSTTTGTVTLNSPVTIANTLDLSRGKIITTTSNILLLDVASSVINVSDSSFVNGPASKRGATDFIFPVGKQTEYRPIGILSLNGSDVFTAEYFHTDPNAASYDVTLKDPTLAYISRCEYWSLTQTTATASQVILSWDSAFSCGINTLPDLRVANWNGSMWKDIGNFATTGTTVNGNIYSMFPPVAYTVFTVGSGTLTTNVKEPSSVNNELQIFPNPSSRISTLQFNSVDAAPYQLFIYDAAGRNIMMQNGQAAKGTNTIQVETINLPSGIYSAQIITGKQLMQIKMVIE